jgi:hypothetical protein
MTNTALRPVKFIFDDGPEFDGFAHDSKWNGFDNVSVTPAVLEEICTYFASLDPHNEDMAEENSYMRALPVVDGLVCLGWGYATTIVDPRPVFLFKVGDRVRLACDVAPYPLGFFPKGARGTVVQITADAHPTQPVASVRMDDHFECLDEWDNELQVCLSVDECGEVDENSFEAIGGEG